MEEAQKSKNCDIFGKNLISWPSLKLWLKKSFYDTTVFLRLWLSFYFIVSRWNGSWYYEIIY